jgi:hypothetical protein
MPIAMIVCGVAGLVHCFLGEPSMWALREVPGLMGPIIVMMVGFAAAAGAGVVAMKNPQKWQPIVALVGSIASLWLWQKTEQLGEIFKLSPLLSDHSAPAILFSIGLYGGVANAIIALVRPPAK